jgi:hypothetical protein
LCVCFFFVCVSLHSKSPLPIPVNSLSIDLTLRQYIQLPLAYNAKNKIFSVLDIKGYGLIWHKAGDSTFSKPVSYPRYAFRYKGLSKYLYTIHAICMSLRMCLYICMYIYSYMYIYMSLTPFHFWPEVVSTTS